MSFFHVCISLIHLILVCLLTSRDTHLHLLLELERISISNIGVEGILTTKFQRELEEQPSGMHELF